jgi:hypothetical protein
MSDKPTGTPEYEMHHIPGPDGDDVIYMIRINPPPPRGPTHPPQAFTQDPSVFRRHPMRIDDPGNEVMDRETCCLRADLCNQDKWEKLKGCGGQWEVVGKGQKAVVRLNMGINPDPQAVKKAEATMNFLSLKPGAPTVGSVRTTTITPDQDHIGRIQSMGAQIGMRVPDDTAIKRMEDQIRRKAATQLKP